MSEMEMETARSPDVRKPQRAPSYWMGGQGAIRPMAGLRFGRLTARKPTDKRSKKGHVYWLCDCRCGKSTIVEGHLLRCGMVRSCGCLLADYRARATRDWPPADMRKGYRRAPSSRRER